MPSVPPTRYNFSAKMINPGMGVLAEEYVAKGKWVIGLTATMKHQVVTRLFQVVMSIGQSYNKNVLDVANDEQRCWVFDLDERYKAFCFSLVK